MALGWVALKCKAVALGLEMGCVPSSTGIDLSRKHIQTSVYGNFFNGSPLLEILVGSTLGLI